MTSALGAQNTQEDVEAILKRLGNIFSDTLADLKLIVPTKRVNFNKPGILKDCIAITQWPLASRGGVDLVSIRNVRTEPRGTHGGSN